MSIFGTRLKELRKNQKLTQPQFAKIMNAGKSTVAMWETGDRHPDYEMVSKIADHFGVSIDYLLGKTDNPKGITYEKNDDELLEEFKEHWNTFTAEEKEEIYRLAKRLGSYKKESKD